MNKVTTAVYSTFKEPCLKAENEAIGCLNGGTCFKIPMHNGSEIFGCSCTEEWDGTRCQFRFADPELWAHDASVASIATGITVGVFLLLASIVGVAVYWWRYRKNRHRTNSEAEGSVRGTDQSHGNDHVLVSPGESKPSYEAYSETESRQNLTLDRETSTSHAPEAEVRGTEFDGIASSSSSSHSSSSPASVAATAEVISTMHHPSADHSPTDYPFIDEECTDLQHKDALISL